MMPIIDYFKEIRELQEFHENIPWMKNRKDGKSMKWIKCLTEEIINLEHMESIFVHDHGKDYSRPFTVKAKSISGDYYYINEFKTEKEAIFFLYSLGDPSNQ